MGVGPHAIELTRIIQEKGFLSEGFNVLEFGSQDFAPTLGEAQAAIRREFALANVAEIQQPLISTKPSDVTSMSASILMASTTQRSSI
jgi:hypothetical protein